MTVVSTRRLVMVDGNEAAARVAHLLSEGIAIYPITRLEMARDTVATKPNAA